MLIRDSISNSVEAAETEEVDPVNIPEVVIVLVQ